MAAESEMVYRWVEWLKCGTDDQQYQAALALRNLAGDAGSKHLIREAGGIESLLRLLDAGTDSMLTVVGAETLSCLAADDSENRDLIRRFGGIQKLVSLLASGAETECTHRALLALRILTDKEADRLAILRAGGVSLLVGLLSSGPDSEVTEYAAAALGNLAAGSQQLKDAIRQSGGIPPLVRLLRDDPDEIAAELAAVVLRNLALQNPANRAAIKDAGGLQPLLRLLSMGQDKLVYPVGCEARVLYNDEGRDGSSVHKQMVGQCCFDPSRGHLCVAVKAEGGVLGCFAPGKQPSPRDKMAERYSLLRKLTITEPDSRTLELNFTVSDKEGAPRITDHTGAIMRMLTRMHLEREFKIGPTNRQQLGQGITSNHSVASFPMSSSNLEQSILRPIQPTAAA
eukprot:jgi/Astpho2/7776/fgenesh1_pg.00117_%23_7_t